MQQRFLQWTQPLFMWNIITKIYKCDFDKRCGWFTTSITIFRSEQSIMSHLKNIFPHLNSKSQTLLMIRTNINWWESIQNSYEKYNEHEWWKDRPKFKFNHKTYKIK
jgi:hypothetical protein